eukprot:6404346-Amphidinium_carterae.1
MVLTGHDVRSEAVRFRKQQSAQSAGVVLHLAKAFECIRHPHAPSCASLLLCGGVPRLTGPAMDGAGSLHGCRRHRSCWLHHGFWDFDAGA